MFRARVDLVQLDVVVLDRERRPVTGLNASDFRVLENGVDRPIRAFTAVHLPPPPRQAPTPASLPIRPDVATNAVGAQDGRLVVILMDRSIPPGEPTLTARRIAHAAVAALGPQDLAAVVSTSGGVPQNLTSDRARLAAAIDQRDWSTGLTKEQEEIVGKDDPLSDGRCLCGLCVLETITRIADAVQHSPRRRKMVLFIGSRLIVQAGPRAPSADIGCGRRVEDTRLRMVESLGRSSVTIHALDPGGLANVGAHTRAGARGGRPGQNAPAVRRQALQADIAEHLEDQGTLQYLPELTGGRAVLNVNAPQDAIGGIFAESASYYVLAYEPGGGPAAAGGVRSLEVRTARPGARVYAQRHHVVAGASGTLEARRPGVSPALERALEGLLPVATRRLSVGAAAFAGSGTERALVLLNVDVGAFVADAVPPVRLELAMAAVDQAGREVAFGRDAATVTFDPASARPADANLQTHLALPPGDYELRVAVRDAASDVVASVYSAIEVPEFGTAPLTLSHVLLEAGGRGAPSSTRAGPELAGTTRRVFDQQEAVRAVLQVYQGTHRSDPLDPVGVRMTVAGANGRTVRDQIITIPPGDFAQRRAGLRMDLGGLAPGEYALVVEARRQDVTARRTVGFSMR